MVGCHTCGGQERGGGGGGGGGDIASIKDIASTGKIPDDEQCGRAHRSS